MKTITDQGEKKKGRCSPSPKKMWSGKAVLTSIESKAEEKTLKLKSPLKVVRKSF